MSSNVLSKHNIILSLISLICKHKLYKYLFLLLSYYKKIMILECQILLKY